jgi:DNA-binding transcriptional LysR family regulator
VRLCLRHVEQLPRGDWNLVVWCRWSEPLLENNESENAESGKADRRSKRRWLKKFDFRRSRNKTGISVRFPTGPISHSPAMSATIRLVIETLAIATLALGLLPPDLPLG